MNLKRISAILMIIAVVLSLAGCNYIGRPSGAANNSEDISSMLKNLLIIPSFNYEEAPEGDPEYDYVGPDLVPMPDEEPEPEPEPEPDPDPVYTPFTSTFDSTTLLSKIDELVQAAKAVGGPADSATGVSDELLNGRSIKIMVPDNFPIAEEDEAVKALAEQYGCSVNVRRAGTGSTYVANCRKAALSGDKVDLMYVDNSVWGDIHSFTQPIQSFINMELGDEVGTYTSAYSEKFFVQDTLDASIINYYVAAGMGAPYLLIYNKDNLKAATLAEETVVNAEGAKTTLREIKVTDPVEMYANGTWGINAFTAMLQASTKGSNVGIASEIDRLDGLDIWYGMEDFAGFRINSATGVANLAAQEELTPVNKSVDVVQDWYWNLKGEDQKNYIGSFAPADDYSDEIVFEKLFNCYNGNDAIKSFSFVGSDLQDLAAIDKMAEATGNEWEYVAYPYGETYEDTYRAMTEEELNAAIAAGDEGTEKFVTPVAGWVGGFAVMKTCQNPSVALRVGEEYVKIWKADYEAPYLKVMNEEQLARYEDMKSNIGVSFVRAWAEKSADVNAAYPGYSKYFYSFNYAGGTNVSGNSMHTLDPDAFSTDRSYYLGLIHFDNNAELVVAPMYHKNQVNTIYNPDIQTSWSGFMDGQPSSAVETGKDTGSMARILNATLMPGTVLFAE
ncbi:MAG: hypothetical protein IJ995_06010 [Clostridia bacterium]|nr:hypothetical protein [Clostridia bacterium]